MYRRLIVKGEATTKLNSVFSLHCPYCGTHIRARFNQPHYSIGGIISFSLSPGVSVASSFVVHCDFCGRKYRYYEMNNDFDFLFSISQFSKPVIAWLKRYDVPLDKLPSLTIAVVEPLDDSPYKRFLRNVRRIFGRQRFRFIEIIFRLRKGKKEYRGVLVGRLFMGSCGRMFLNISNKYWINEPPIGE